MTAVALQNKSTTVRSEKSASPALLSLHGGMLALSRVAPSAAAVLAERMFMTPRRFERPEAERAVLETGQRFVLETKYGALAAWSWGTEGPRVLLVHGWEGRGSQLGPFVEPLVGLGFRVATFDAPAHGDSPGERSSFFHFASAIQAAREALGPLHAIVAHSMGGATTLWASRDEPLAARTVMVAPPIDLRHFTRAFTGALGLPETVREALHGRLTSRFGVRLEDARAEVVARTMTTPLLVVHDEDDREVPLACGQAMARAWPGAELLVTRGLGHRKILRDTLARKAILRFVIQGRRGAAA